MKPTILNTSILTDFGGYMYEKLTTEEAKELLKAGFESAVGHQSTCDVLSKILGVCVPLNRAQYKQELYGIALVFKLKTRLEEGKILSTEELEKLDFEFGKLTRVF